ncbi:MAG: T9SS type A sorting domain-containing protein [Rhodothermales bacterium]|nr:T9SS type A sorting domain-containing protein [Rhodothermales bacterium]
MATSFANHGRRTLLRLAVIAFAAAALAGIARAQSVGTCSPALGEAYLDVNNVRARILNNGGLFYRGEPHVYNVPKGSPTHAIFATNIWIAGYVGSETTPRAAGTTYGPWEFWAGPIDDNGNPPSDCSAYDRLYNIYRSDIEAYEATGIPTNDLRDWPTGLGAPTLAPTNNSVDDDGDGEIDEAGEELAFDINVPLAQRKDRVIDLEAGERPAILGDQMIWWVMNDVGNVHERSNGEPIGIEMHGSAFAFRQVARTGDDKFLPIGPIGDATFYRFQIYVRNALPLNRTYFGMYIDPDLGNFSDDYVGSDSTLGIGYVFNADNDDNSIYGYGSPPPALGYDFVQGPIVPSPTDTARVGGHLLHGFRNLPMTSFVFFNGGGSSWTGDPVTPVEFYNYMNGHARDGLPITYGGNGRDRVGGGSTIPTRFMFSGDPYSNTGWTERNPDPFTSSVPPISPADRQFVIATGPFQLNPGDFQEITFAVVFAKGTDNWESVAALRRADQAVQALFDNNFQLATPPGGPLVTATATDREVVLEWSNPASSNNYLDGYRQFDPLALADPGTSLSERYYRFEGYDILQFTSEADSVGAVIATYDLVNGVTRIVEGLPNELNEELARGTDSGVQHFHRIAGLTNYRTYHLGVRAYAYNEISFPRILRGDVARVTVTPARTLEDIPEASREAAENLAEPDLIGFSNRPTDGFVWVDVVSPGRVRQATYTVEFYDIEVDAPAALREEDAIDPAPATAAKTARATASTYDIKRDGLVVFDGSANGRPAPLREGVAVIDGLRFSVLGPDFGIKAFAAVANSAGPIDPPDMGAFAFNSSGFPTLVESGITPEGTYPFSDRPNSGIQQVSGANWGFHAGGASIINFDGDPAFAGNFVSRSLRNDNRTRLADFDWEMRFTPACAAGINGVIEMTDCLAWRHVDNDPREDGAFAEVPFELWRVGVGSFGDPSDDLRLIPGICEEACAAGTDSLVFDLGGDHPISGGDNDPFTDWVYWNLPVDQSAGEQGYRDFFAGVTTETGGEVLGRTVLVNFNGGTLPTVNAPLPEVGTVFRIYTNKPARAGDVFTIDTRGFGVVPTEGPIDVAAIGVVPNPYIGASIYERSRGTDEVRFTNLPPEATIRVFTLNGTLIKTISKNSPDRFITWDLETDSGLPIGSGIYLIHVEVPGVTSKTLKFAVVKKKVTPSGVLGN